MIASPIFVVFATFLLALVCTLGVRSFAWRFNFVARPTSDRWHKKPTAMLGGVAIYLAAAVAFFTLVPYSKESFVLFGAASLLFVIGLVDDLISIRPYQKLIGQLAGAGL